MLVVLVVLYLAPFPAVDTYRFQYFRLRLECFLLTHAYLRLRFNIYH